MFCMQMEKFTTHPCGHHPRWNNNLEKISRKGLDVEDVAFLTAIAVSRALGLLMGCKLRVSQECGSIAVEQILGSMDSSTETTRPPGHRALLSGHLDKPECREKEISNTGKEHWKLLL